jgi:hypothetical protein
VPAVWQTWHWDNKRRIIGDKGLGTDARDEVERPVAVPACVEYRKAQQYPRSIALVGFVATAFNE